MRKALLTLILATTACALLGSGSHADSLFVPGKSRSMFADRKARGVGDILTIMVTETTLASLDAGSGQDRETQLNAEGGSGFFFKLFKLLPSATLAGKSKTSGNGSTNRTARLAGKISVRVTEVTPSGQMLIQGERIIRTNQDTQTIKFTGVARPEDVQPDNTIQSGFIADARIEVTGKGPINSTVRPGLLPRLLRFLF